MKIDRVHVDAIRRTIEDQAFLMSVPEEEAADVCAAPAEVAACVAFRGPMSGTLTVSMSRHLMKEIAVNVLGLEGETPGEDDAADALKELANVICGNLLPEIAGPRAVFDVGAPEIVAPREGGEALTFAEGRVWVAFEADGGGEGGAP